MDRASCISGKVVGLTLAAFYPDAEPEEPAETPSVQEQATDGGRKPYTGTLVCTAANTFSAGKSSMQLVPSLQMPR